MPPIAQKLTVGYWSLEVWGGATFDVPPILKEVHGNGSGRCVPPCPIPSSKCFCGQNSSDIGTMLMMCWNVH
jgi:hypothetical protein